MKRVLRNSSIVLAAICLASACSTLGNQAYERPDCHSKSTDEDCTNFVNNHKLKLGNRDHGFDAAHKKQGYENLRERRRERREGRPNTNPFFGGTPSNGTPSTGVPDSGARERGNQ